jgi:hypothetical protein
MNFGMAFIVQAFVHQLASASNVHPGTTSTRGQVFDSNTWIGS